MHDNCFSRSTSCNLIVHNNLFMTCSIDQKNDVDSVLPFYALPHLMTSWTHDKVKITKPRHDKHLRRDRPLFLHVNKTTKSRLTRGDNLQWLYHKAKNMTYYWGAIDFYNITVNKSTTSSFHGLIKLIQWLVSHSLVHLDLSLDLVSFCVVNGVEWAKGLLSWLKKCMPEEIEFIHFLIL